MTNIFQFIITLALCMCFVNCDADEEFSKYIEKYNKFYTEQEYPIKKKIFESNLEKIENHNKLGKSYQMGINQFADLSESEFYTTMKLDKSAIIMKNKAPTARSVLKREEDDDENSGLGLPKRVDLRKRGYINEVQDQGECGSCWAFSAICSIESQYARKTGTLLKLSEQQLVSCDDGNFGCEGGWMDKAFEYFIDEDLNICTEADYPYIGSSDSCDANTCNKTMKVVDLNYVRRDSDRSMMRAVSRTAVAVAISVTSNFQLYTSGVFEDDTCSDAPLNHAVNIVGYGVEKGQSYYLIRNSWGEEWGEGGYIKVKRGDKSNPSGTCNILKEGTYPIIQVDES